MPVPVLYVPKQVVRLYLCDDMEKGTGRSREDQRGHDHAVLMIHCSSAMNSDAYQDAINNLAVRLLLLLAPLYFPQALVRYVYKTTE